LAPNSSMRQQVIQTAGPSPALFERLADAARCMGLYPSKKMLPSICDRMIELASPRHPGAARLTCGPC
ncbi:hypothetical protein JXA88_18210, partial [Candidatus Fermentibacteria bacterium]|nr:hypothetical protein [Candidatus Fermentibacteria bacterium]